MIQFYKVVTPKYTIEPVTYKVSGDIMEHILVGNQLLNVVMNNLAEGGHLYKEPIVWTGNLHWSNLYDTIKPSASLLTQTNHYRYRFLFNGSKKQFIDLTDVEPIHTVNSAGESVDVNINPLPLLVCDSYGLGSNETYYDTTLFGFWVGDIIMPTNIIPPMTYNQLIFNLICV